MNYSGLAKIIPFIPRARVEVGPPWSTAELGELFRVAHVLRQSGMAIETDMGLSDEGDPWFVFYSSQTEDVIAHFARLNGIVVVHGLSATGVVSGVDLNDVVRRLAPVQALRQQQRNRSDSSVVMHPFMILVAFVAASFLATEESQAASPGAGTTDRAAEVAKTKADWIDRAITLLQSKSKDRADNSQFDGPNARKFAPTDTAQHSMALVMLAAAISQAQADFAASTGDALDVSTNTRLAPPVYKVVADAVVPQSDALSAFDLSGPPASNATVLNDSHAGDASAPDHLAGVAASLLVTSLVDTDTALPTSIASSGAVPVPVSLISSAPLPMVVASAPEHLNLPETVPLTGGQVVFGGSANVVGKAVVSTLPLVSLGPASFDLMLEGGTLQFHQNLNLIDIRLLDKNINAQKAPATVGADPEWEIFLLVVAKSEQILSLSDARESVLIDKGFIGIRNFTFGVDQLVLKNPEMMSKAPEVLFSYTGDIIISFSETTRVTLLGVFNPSDMLAGIASVSVV